jgi:hypothetical protein
MDICQAPAIFRAVPWFLAGFLLPPENTNNLPVSIGASKSSHTFARPADPPVNRIAVFQKLFGLLSELSYIKIAALASRGWRKR